VSSGTDMSYIFLSASAFHQTIWLGTCRA